MGFFNYVVMGAIAYGLGWLVRSYVLNGNVLNDKELNGAAATKSATGKTDNNAPAYGLKHPLIIGYLVGFFIVMMMVSALIGRYILKHTELDIAFILVNSAVATFVFSFGLIKDQVKHDLPD